MMKTIYFIRHAKAGWSVPDTSDFERSLSKRGKKDINTMGSYLALRGINPDIILSSCALRAQQTTDRLADKIAFKGKKFYLRELYFTSVEMMGEIISIQDDSIDSMFIVGHNPYLHELVNTLIDEHISKFPSLGIIAIDFNTESWANLATVKGKINFFIFPKQFKYYMPGHIRGFLTN